MKAGRACHFGWYCRALARIYSSLTVTQTMQKSCIRRVRFRESKTGLKYPVYRINSKYWNRYAFANNLDPDQMPQNAASDQGLTICHAYSIILDTWRCGRMNYLKL